MPKAKKLLGSIAARINPKLSTTIINTCFQTLQSVTFLPHLEKRHEKEIQNTMFLGLRLFCQHVPQSRLLKDRRVMVPVSFWTGGVGTTEWESPYDEVDRGGSSTLCWESSVEPWQLGTGGRGGLTRWSFLVAPPLTDPFCWQVSLPWHDSIPFHYDIKEP